jgi:hypothetical protein
LFPLNTKIVLITKELNMKNITLDDFVQLANSNEEINKDFLANPILTMKLNGVEFDDKTLIQNLSPSNALVSETPTPPTFEAFWWGYRVGVSTEFLKWASGSGVTVGAIILGLAPILLLLGPILGPIATGVVAALAVYLLTQHTILIIKATQCGGIVYLDALWIAPLTWTATCG